MNVLELLPIGTVVILKGTPKKIMIIGIKQRDQKNNTLFDYIGVLYPEGFITKEVFFRFNHQDIESIVFKGYENNEQKEFLRKVNEVLKENN
jgi:hypothetical protein